MLNFRKKGWVENQKRTEYTWVDEGFLLIGLWVFEINRKVLQQQKKISSVNIKAACKSISEFEHNWIEKPTTLELVLMKKLT